MIKDFNKAAIITAQREISYTEMLQRIHHFASQEMGQRGDRVIILSENREGWIYALFAIWQRKQIATPIDAGSTVADVAHILSDCKPTAVWTTRTKLHLVEQAMQMAQHEMTVLLIDEHEQTPLNASAPKAVIETSPKDTGLIIYTSGTTGLPKGVMLSFENMNDNVTSVSIDVPIFSSERRALILLPLHHVLPLLGSIVAPICTGGGVAICPSMSGPDIMDTLCRGKVGIIIGVPRLWQTLYAGIKKKIDAHFITRMLFALCAAVGSRKLSRTIFRSVHQKMGGHLDYCVSGGASLDLEIGRGLRTLGLDVLEGYGMTEAAPMIAFTRPDDIIPGCSGKPLPRVACKIVNGEILVKGANVMQGYYNRPEETAQAIDADGFLHTGDLARFDEQGRVYITGRSKELIVLSNGKNIQPAEIEFKLEQFATQVEEAAVVQDGDLLRAILVPQPAWAAGKSEAEIEAALKQEVIEAYNQSVAGYKKIMGILVTRTPLPRTRLDKLQRFKLQELLANAASLQPQTKSEAAAEPEPEPTFAEYQLLKRFLAQEKQTTVRPGDHLETDLALDSLDKVSLQGFVERSFGVSLSLEQITSLRTVLAMAEYIAGTKTRIEEDEEADWKTLLGGNTISPAQDSPQSPAPSHRALIRTLGLGIKAYNRLSVSGREHIPASGPYILAPNHESFLDSPIVLNALGGEALANCYAYATEDHVRSSFAKRFARRHNIVVMKRADLKHSICQLAALLKQGKSVLIFPEGTRTKNGTLGDFKKTFAILSMELDVPVVPVCINGAFQALPRHASLPRPCRISVSFLPAVKAEKDESYQMFANRIRSLIAAHKS